MPRLVIGLLIALIGPTGQALGQTGALGRTPGTPQGREASVRPRAAPSKPARAAPPTQTEQPVTPATDYYPYDRRTGGM